MDNIFYFNDLEWNSETNELIFSGFLTIKGIDNIESTDITYDLILTNKNTNENIELPIDRWISSDYPLNVPNENGFDYSNSWFNGVLDINSVPQGDYSAIVRARTGEYETSAALKNLFSVDISRSFSDDLGRGYLFRTDYYDYTVPLEIFIRDEGLIAEDTLPTSDNMFNIYYDMDFSDGELNILGASYNVGGNYASSVDVTRTLTLENTETFTRYTYGIGSITDGPVPITLRVSDGKDKTRSWYDASINLKDLEAGRYAILIRTDDGNINDYGELTDIFNSELPSGIDLGRTVATLELNQEERSRIELVIEDKDNLNDIQEMEFEDNNIILEGYAYSNQGETDNADDISYTLNVLDSDNNIVVTNSGLQEDVCHGWVLQGEQEELDCWKYDPIIGYRAELNLEDVASLGNGTYTLELITHIDGFDDYSAAVYHTSSDLNRLIRKEVNGKLVSFDYTDNKVSIIISDFEYDYDVFIDVGHSWGPSDGVGATAYNGAIGEPEANIIVSEYEKERYEEHGLTVYMNRTSTNDEPLTMGDDDWKLLSQRAYALAYYAPTSKIIYSNHHNGSVSSARGYEIIVPAELTASELTVEKAIYDAWDSISNPSSNQSGFYTRDYYSNAFKTKVNGEVYDYLNYYAVIRLPYELSDSKLVIYEPAYMTNSSEWYWYWYQGGYQAMSEIKIKYYVESLGITYIPN